MRRYFAAGWIVLTAGLMAGCLAPRAPRVMIEPDYAWVRAGKERTPEPRLAAAWTPNWLTRSTGPAESARPAAN